MKKLIVLIITILILESVLTGLIPHSRGMLFGYLESKVGPIYLALLLYFLNYLFLDFFQSIKGYCITKLALLCRRKRTLDLMFNHKDNIPNADQRIQEDIKLSYQNRFTVWAEYFISGTIVAQLLLINISVPILSAAALGYALLSVLIAYKFNPRLRSAEVMVQQEEANFRAKYQSIRSFFTANDASLRAEKIKTEYLLFTKLQLGLVTVLPYIILIPSLLNGSIDLGTLIKHQATFALIVVNAAILIQYYTVLIKGKASEERVRDLEKT